MAIRYAVSYSRYVFTNSVNASVTGSESAGPVSSMNVVGLISTTIKTFNLLINNGHQVSRRIVHRDIILFEKLGFTPSNGVNIILFDVSVSPELTSSPPSPDLSLLGFFLLSDDSLLRAAAMLLVLIAATAVLTSLGTTSLSLTRV